MLKMTRYKFNVLINKNIEELYKLDNWHGILALLWNYSIVAFFIYAGIHIHWLYPVCIFVIASRQRALATLQHEASHYTLSKNRILNYILGNFLSGALIYQNFQAYLKSHVKKHHAFLGDPEFDPDYQYHIKLGLYNSAKNIKKMSLCSFSISYLKYLITNRLGSILTKEKYPTTTFLMNVLILSLCGYMGILQYYLLYWIVPLLTFYQFIGWVIELSEHYPLVNKSKIDLHMTRNRFSHWIERLFFGMHNESYHLVHHLKPRVPFWNIKKAHQILMKDENYADVNKKMGGIFYSKNGQKTLWQIFMTNKVTFAGAQ